MHRVYPYIPNSNPIVRKEMLDYIGKKSVEEMYQFLPKDARMHGALHLPEPFESELALKAHVDSILSVNSTCSENISFLGAGCYDHYVPAICDEINSRSEFLTAYSGDTYVDHGKCQAYFEFNSLMGELLDMDVVSFPTYDGGHALCTAILMSHRINNRKNVLLPASFSPSLLSQVQCYCDTMNLITIAIDKRGQTDIEDLKQKINNETDRDVEASTFCFSHVIDYMNKDYETQESTEEYTEYILKKDKYILECLKKDKISIHDLIDFKKYSLVDNERPRVCADRLDGVILNGISWTKTMTPEKIQNILNSLAVFQNEEGEKEIGFTSYKVAHDVMKESFLADSYCHSKEDNYMMELLAHITSLAIQKNYVSYENLYTYKEDQVFYFLKSIPDKELRSLLYKFEHIKEKDIPNIEMPYIKQRILRPMVNGQRIAKSS